MIDAAVAAGGKGIVLAGFGRGGTPLQSAALRRAAEKGVIVVTASRSAAGSVSRGSNRISAGVLNAQKARVLLMLALTRATDAAAVAKVFVPHTGGEY